MGFIKKRMAAKGLTKSLAVELTLLKGILRAGLNEDVRRFKATKHLQSKGFISKSGRTTAKGKKALRLL